MYSSSATGLHAIPFYNKTVSRGGGRRAWPREYGILCRLGQPWSQHDSQNSREFQCRSHATHRSSESRVNSRDSRVQVQVGIRMHTYLYAAHVYIVLRCTHLYGYTCVQVYLCIFRYIIPIGGNSPLISSSKKIVVKICTKKYC